jgi:clan AA aspartic protease
MIRGEVDPYDQAIIPLHVRRPDGQWEAMEVVVDTGFTGYLTLPPARIGALQLRFQQRQTYTLGDGSDVEFDVYLATVLWEGHDRDIAVLAAEGDVLTGMRMLRGHRLLIDVIDGGDVLIEARP